MLSVSKIHTSIGHRAAVYALTSGLEEGRFLSAGGDGWIAEWQFDQPENGRLVASVETQLYSLCSLPDYRLLAAGNMNGGLYWIDLDKPERGVNIQHHQKGIYAIRRFGEHLFTAGGDGRLTRWSLSDRKSLESFHLSAKALRCIALCEARGEMAIGASDGAIFILDLETLALKNRIEAAHLPSVFAAVYSPDAGILLSGGRDAMLRAWDVRSGYRQVSEQPAHLFTLNDIVFSPDHTLFATASRDKTIKIWDAASLKLLKVVDWERYYGHRNSVNALHWRGDYLVSASDDRSTILWKIEREN